MSRQNIGRTPRWLAACAAAGVLLGAVGLAPETADAQTPISVSASETSVVGDGTNQVTFTFSWQGTINFDGDPIEFQILDPDNGFNTQGVGLIQSGIYSNVRQESPPSSGMGPVTYTLTTQTLSPGDTSRSVTVNVIAFAGSPYVVDSSNGSVEVTVTAPTLDKPAISVSASQTSVVGDGTNQVTFTFNWSGTISTFPTDEFWFEVSDPDDGFDLTSLTFESGNIVQTASPASGMGPITYVSTTRALSPGDDDRTMTVSVWAYPTSPYVVDPDNGSVEVTVTAPPALPEVTVEAVAASVVGGASAEFILTRTGDMASELTVTISISGDGVSGTPAPPTTATFQENSATAMESVATNTLTAGASSQSVMLTIEPGSGTEYTVGSSSTATVTVTAPPAVALPVVTVAAGANSVVGGENAEFILTRTGDMASTLAVDISVTGNGISGTPIPPTTATFPANSATAMVSVATNTLTAGDANQSVVLTIPSGSGTEYTVGSSPGNMATVTVTAPPAGTLPVVTVMAKNAQVIGGTDPAVFVLTRTGDTAAALVLDITMGGENPAYSNFGNRPNMATIPAGSQSYDLEVETSAQSDGDSWAMTLTVNAVSGRYTVGDPAMATVDVNEFINLGPAMGMPEVQGTLEVGQTLMAVRGVITDQDGLMEAIYGYSWMRADDASGMNEEPIPHDGSSSYTLQDGELNKHIQVEVFFMDDNGNQETVSSEWTATAVMAAPLSEVALPEVTVEAVAASVVGGANAVFTLTRTGGDLATALTVAISVTGNGILGTPPTTATFQATSPTATLSVPTNTLAAGASRQSVTLTIQPGSGNEYTVGSFPGATATVTVEPMTSTPAPGDVTVSGIFTIGGPSAAITEPATGTADLTFAVSLVRSAGQEAASLTVDYRFTGSASEGRDFTEHSGAQRLEFGPRVTERTITVTVNSDIVAEQGGETVVVTLVNPSQGASLGTTSSATVTINEPPTQISVVTTEPRYTKEDRTIRFNITLSRPAPVAGMVEWRLVFEGTAGIAAASVPSAEGRAAERCTLSRCTGSAQFAAGSRVPREAPSAVFSSDLPVGTVVSLQVKPFAAASGSTLLDGTSVAVLPPSSGETVVTADSYVVTSRRVLAASDQSALVHTIADTGHSIAVGIVDGLWRRVEAHRNGGLQSRATLGGRTLDTQALSSGDAGLAVREIASLLGIEATVPDSSPDGLDNVYGGGIDDYRVWAGIPSPNRLARQTSFALSAGEGTGNGPVAIWGEFSTSTRESKPGRSSFVESESSDILVGFDLPVSPNTSYGLAVSLSSGDMNYGNASVNATADTAETGITTMAPYIYWSTPSGGDRWVSFGIGSGTLTQSVGSGTVEADMSVQMLAAGIRNDFWENSQDALSLKIDALLASTESKRAGPLSAVDADSSRTRLAVEWTSSRLRAEKTSPIFHKVEMGVRMDGGDADKGVGADIASELRYVSRHGLELHGQASMTLLHFQDGVKNWGAGLGAVYDPGSKGRGASLSLEPTWNVPRSGVAESMWESWDLGGYAFSNTGGAMKARLGYGAEARRVRALATLYGEAETGDKDRKLRLGAELRGLPGPLERLSLDIYGERRESQSSSPSGAVMLEGSLGF